MKIHTPARMLVPLGILSLFSCVAWARQSSLQLTMDERVLSTDIQLIKGRAYVPLNDIAKLLDRTVIIQGKTYNFMRTPRAQQLRAPAGKLATNQFSGTWRFLVQSVQQVPTYTPLFGSNKDPLMPVEAGDMLVLVTCQLRNGAPDIREVSFDKTTSGNTALMDAQERGYVPIAFDARSSDYTSAKIPSSTTRDFVLIFSVPKDAVLTQLTYAIGETDRSKRTEFRIAL